MPLSSRQMEYLALAWQCFETEPKVDYDKFREVAGLSSAASARELMRVTKNKLKTEYGALGNSVRASKTPTATPVKNGNGAGVGTPGGSGKGAVGKSGGTSVTAGRKRGRVGGVSVKGSVSKGVGEGDAGVVVEEDEEEVEVASPCRKKAKGGKGGKGKQKAVDGQLDGEDYGVDGGQGEEETTIVKSEPVDCGLEHCCGDDGGLFR
ncbi:hypothetical protein MBLNU230_g1388t1 [Neophaeotheca triangularis]